MVAQSEAFQKAVVDSKKLTSKPSNEDLLEIYALYKIGTGEDIEKAPKPGMFDLKAGGRPRLSFREIGSCKAAANGLTHEPQAKAKYNAWRAKVDDGISVEEAQEKYVAKIEEMKTKYGYDENKEPEAVGGQ
ncbi:72c30f52-7cb3-48a0-b420-9bb99a26acbf [Thermothielavioides terrestris]|uniref:ACB domain-containing protein n=2 Tax=Thermothielavioides terrestris TaxID=2587410 RepID=G2RDP0_THETT|nr:uncharacterized protein THITE_2122632 [Thermothielavioides terrestris NRRL 8126]AEO70825.1 hypothetical protein THITE_2122632 [Thermothielavioides terrestris NRRL 8126]SPQ25192.1 72c30f52-7cb3-48a0-b420-9bb99a26acbf [Thermothielavioides terrestris]